MNDTSAEAPAVLAGVRVGDVMRRDFEMVDGMNTISDVLRMLRFQHAHCLVVYKAHPEDEYGVLLVSDIGREVLVAGRSPDRVNVYEVMAKPAITVPAGLDLANCARVLERCRISLAPVVDDEGTLVGVASLGDLVINGLLPRLAAPTASELGKKS